MSKINPADYTTNSFLHAQAAGNKKSDKPKSVFRGLLSNLTKTDKTEEATVLEANGVDSDAAIESLLDAVHTAGDELKKNISTAAIQTYKQAVRRFVHFVVENAYSVEEKNSGKNILKRKKYTQLAIIDEKLEHFAAEILSGQRDKMDILARLDEIHGLLIDLLH